MCVATELPGNEHPSSPLERAIRARRVASRVRLEVAKDLSTQTMTALWKALSPKLNVAVA